MLKYLRTRLFSTFVLLVCLQVCCSSYCDAEIDSCLFVDTVLEIPIGTNAYFKDNASFRDESWDGPAFVTVNRIDKRLGIVRIEPDYSNYHWRYLDDLDGFKTKYEVADVNNDGYKDIAIKNYVYFQDSHGNFTKTWNSAVQYDFVNDWDDDGNKDSDWHYGILESEITYYECDRNSNEISLRKIPFLLEDKNRFELLGLLPNFCGQDVVLVGEEVDPNSLNSKFYLHFYSQESSELLHSIEVPFISNFGSFLELQLVDWDNNGKLDIVFFNVNVIVNHGDIQDTEITPITFSYDHPYTVKSVSSVASDDSKWDVSVSSNHITYFASVDSNYHLTAENTCGYFTNSPRNLFLTPDGRTFVSEYSSVDVPDVDHFLIQRIKNVYSYSYDSLWTSNGATLATGDTIVLFGHSECFSGFDESIVVLKSKFSGYINKPFKLISSGENNVTLVCIAPIQSNDALELVVSARWRGADTAVSGYRTVFQGIGKVTFTGRPKFRLVQEESLNRSEYVNTLVDIDRDGYLDVVIRYSPNRYFLNTWMTDSLFEELESTSEPNVLFHPHSFFDVDKDGDLDLFHVYKSKTYVFDNYDDFETGDTLCEIGISGWYGPPSSSHWSDLDTDGEYDAFGVTDKLMTYSSQFAGCIDKVAEYADLFREQDYEYHGVVSNDFNCDGLADYVFIQSSEGRLGYRVVSAGQFAPIKSVFLPIDSVDNEYYTSPRYRFDVNRDGILDVFLTNYSTKDSALFIIGDCEGNYRFEKFHTGSYIEPRLTWDFDGDQVMDLFFYAYNKYLISYGKDPFDVQYFEEFEIESQHSIGLRNLIPADFDLDGDVDLVGSDDKRLFWLENNPDGTPVSVSDRLMNSDCEIYVSEEHHLVTSCQSSLGNVEIVDRLGRIVFTRFVESSQLSLYGLNLPVGIFFVRNCCASTSFFNLR